MARNPLTLADREEISRGLACGMTNKEIAAAIDRRESVISEEIARHGGRIRIERAAPPRKPRRRENAQKNGRSTPIRG